MRHIKKESSNFLFDERAMSAIKQCITGLTVTETTTEYAMDEETGKLKVIKQKVNEKTIPPNIDIIKLIYQQLVDVKTDYNLMTDEELQKEKERLLKQLEEENDGGKSKSQGEM